MRTNIEIDDSLIAKAMALMNARTKKETVTLALAEQIRSAKRKKFLLLKGKILWEGDLKTMRSI